MPFNHLCAYTIGPPSEGESIRRGIAASKRDEINEFSMRQQNCRRILLQGVRKSQQRQQKRANFIKNITPLVDKGMFSRSSNTKKVTSVYKNA